MIALVLHESRMVTRRGVWPAVLVLHAVAASAFVAMWGPTGGVPLWEASSLHQLSAADRILSAVLLTWLTTFVLTDEASGRRRMADWAVLTGRPTQFVYGARIIVAIFLALIFIAAAAPAFAAAGASSAATSGDAATQFFLAAAFAVFALGVTAMASVALNDRVAIWCTAMVVSLVAAVAIQGFTDAWLRLAVPSGCGLLLIVASYVSVTTQRLRRAG